MTDSMQEFMPEWSHRVCLETISLNPIRCSISASPAERKDLARRLSVDAIDLFEAELTLVRKANSIVIYVAGVLKARVLQKCGITHDPIEDIIEENIEAWYGDQQQAVPLAKIRRKRQENMMDVESRILSEEEDPEPVSDGFIDVAELITQHLSLSVNPYPKHEGVEFESNDGFEGYATPIRKNPFSVLKKLKFKDKTS